MRQRFLRLPKRQRLFGSIFLVYSILNSLLLEEKIGLISLIFLAFYFLINLSQKASYKITFLMSLILLTFATVLYVLDVTYTLAVPIKKFSEWSYLFLLLGTMQLIVSSKTLR